MKLLIKLKLEYIVAISNGFAQVRRTIYFHEKNLVGLVQHLILARVEK